MRPDTTRVRRRDPRPHRDQHQGADRARRGPRSRAPRSDEGVRQPAADAGVDAGGLAPALGREARSRSCRTYGSAMRSLRHARGLAATVALMLALGIGANAAVFSVVRQVLFRPLVNRDADRLVYVRQSAPGLGAENTTFSMAEIRDLRARLDDDRRVRRLLDDRLHDGRLRRAARGEGGRRLGLVLRGDGPAARCSAA